MKKRTKVRYNVITMGVIVLILAGVAALRSPLMQNLERNQAMILLARYALSQDEATAAADLQQAQQAINAIVEQDPTRYRPIAEHLDARAQVLHDNRTAPDADVELSLQRLFESRTADADDAANVRDLKKALTPMRTNACPTWQLEGSRLHPTNPAMAQSAALLLVWQRPREAQSANATAATLRVAPTGGPADGWRMVVHADTVLQFADSENLIADGGFERELKPVVRIPIQLPTTLYRLQNAAHTAIVQAGDNPRAGFALQLDGRGETPVGVASQVFRLPTHADAIAYWVTGRYRSDAEADPRIGIQWLNSKGATQEVVSFMFVAQEPSPTWVTFRWLVVPRADADAMALWVLNRDPHSRMVVDDLGLFAVPLPCKDLWGS